MIQTQLHPLNCLDTENVCTRKIKQTYTLWLKYKSKQHLVQ